MFSKESKAPITPTTSTTPAGTYGADGDRAKITGVPSIISPDLKIIGDLKSSGDIQIDGRIEGDIHSRRLRRRRCSWGAWWPGMVPSCLW